MIESVIQPDNLRLAFWKASKGKRYSRKVLAFQRDLDDNLLKLRKEIESGLIRVGDYRYFKIFDPKERLICSSAFDEQVLHHALMNICHADFERYQIYHSYASRKGKGTYAAISKAKQYSRNHKWYLKLDMRKYFASIHHEVMKSQLSRMYKDNRLLEIFGKIIDSYQASPRRGMPIGSLTSQYFANHYLAKLDHMIKEGFKVKAYVRYMDDLVMWGNEKKSLKKLHNWVEDYVHTQLRLEIKPGQLNRTQNGLPFLGYKIFPHSIKLTQRSKRRFIKKIGEIEKNFHLGFWNEATCQRRALALFAFIFHAETHGLRENIILRLNGLSS